MAPTTSSTSGKEKVWERNGEWEKKKQRYTILQIVHIHTTYIHMYINTWEMVVKTFSEKG